MTDTARDLIQRLADLADALDGRKRLVSSQGQALDGFTALANFKAIADEARAYLAQSEPEGPTDKELWELYDQRSGEPEDWPWIRDYARAVLARWGK